MELALLMVTGAAVWAALWILFILLQTLLYAALTCATGFGGLYIGSCVQSAELFVVNDVSVTSSGIIAFLLMVAAFKFLGRFWLEASTAMPRILHPFSAAKS